MDAGRPEAAEILDQHAERRDDVRLATYVEVDDATLRLVEERLDAQRETISRFFRVRLTAREGAGFVRYPDGGYYRPHWDRADMPSFPGAARRRVAVVVFLNDDFGGGVLRILDGGGDIVPSTGTLVAFPADALHEVTRVVGGVRDAIVDWYY